MDKEEKRRKAVFAEPISPAERYAEDVSSGGTSNLKYDNEVASGKWQVEKDTPGDVKEQVRLPFDL